MRVQVGLWDCRQNKAAAVCSMHFARCALGDNIRFTQCTELEEWISGLAAHFLKSQDLIQPLPQQRLLPRPDTIQNAGNMWPYKNVTHRGYDLFFLFMDLPYKKRPHRKCQLATVLLMLYWANWWKLNNVRLWTRCYPWLTSCMELYCIHYIFKTVVYHIKGTSSL